MERLIPVASYLNVSEADLAQTQLASHGIPSVLSNVALVLWFWHYSNATGGVKLWVKTSQAKRAQLLLFPKPIPKMFRPAPWNCPHCSAEIDGTWSLCWSCGSARTGERDGEFQRETPFAEESDVKRFLGREMLLPILLSFLVALILFKGSFWILIAFLGILICLAFFSRGFPASMEPGAMRENLPREIPVDQFPDSSAPEEFTPTEIRAERAWRAAFLGFLWFPPLVLYAIWLFCQSIAEGNPVSDETRRRFFWAWLFISLAFLFYLLPLGMIFFPFTSSPPP